MLRRPLESTQYVSVKYTERLAEAGIEPSVESVGDSYGNALAETINGLYKAEVIHRRGPWCSFEAVEFATLEWVDWRNQRRLLEPIGNIPPAEAETRYCDALEQLALAASLKPNSLRRTRSGSVRITIETLHYGAALPARLAKARETLASAAGLGNVRYAPSPSPRSPTSRPWPA